MWFRFRKMVASLCSSTEEKTIINAIAVLNFSVVPVMGDRNQRMLITEAAVGCTRAQVLNLYRCEWITDSFMCSVTESCRLLRVVNLSYCIDITDQGVLTLTKNCPHVETLILRECAGITNLSIKYIAISGWYLRRLNISHCMNISDQGMKWAMQDLHEYYEDSAETTTIEPGCDSIDQENHGNQPGSSQIIDAVVANRLQDTSSVPGLCDTRIRLHQRSSNACVKKHNAFMFLTQLVVSRCVLMTDIGLTSIAKGCPRLRTLNVSGIPLITDIGVSALQWGCRRLVVIDLYGCRQVTAECLVELLQTTSPYYTNGVCLEIRHEAVYELRRQQIERLKRTQQMKKISGSMPGSVPTSTTQIIEALQHVPNSDIAENPANNDASTSSINDPNNVNSTANFNVLLEPPNTTNNTFTDDMDLQSAIEIDYRLISPVLIDPSTGNFSHIDLGHASAIAATQESVFFASQKERMEGTLRRFDPSTDST
eukprot:jgi/Hompol1/1960/HPOL_000596-RA